MQPIHGSFAFLQRHGLTTSGLSNWFTTPQGIELPDVRNDIQDRIDFVATGMINHLLKCHIICFLFEVVELPTKLFLFHAPLSIKVFRSDLVPVWPPIARNAPP